MKPWKHMKPCQDAYILSATARVVPGMLKALVILSTANVKISTVERETQNCSGNQKKKTTVTKAMRKPIVFNLSKFLRTTERKFTGVLLFNCIGLPNVLQHNDHKLGFPTIWKTVFFQAHIWEDQLICEKNQAHSFSELQLDYNQNQMSLRAEIEKLREVMTFQTVCRVET